MPLYEYQCRDCDSQVELLIHAGEEPKCPECGGRELVKLLSVVAAPARDGVSGQMPKRPAGPCGPGCGCHAGH